MRLRNLLFVIISVGFFSTLPAFGQKLTVWPVSVPLGQGAVQLHRPQVDSFEGNLVSALLSIAFQASGDAALTFGSIRLEGRALTDRDTGTVVLCDLTLRRLIIGEGSGLTEAALGESLKLWRPCLPLGAIVPAANRAKQRAAEAQGLSTTAPEILIAYEPTTLVTIDGEPKLLRVEGTTLLRVVNSPFLLVLDPASRTYFLRGPRSWFSAPNLAGPFEPAANPPPAIAAITVPNPPSGEATPTKILLKTGAAELISIRGPARFSPIPGTNLIAVANSDTPLFYSIDTQRLYVVLGGRWFSAAGPASPWGFVAPAELPPGFGLIPVDSPSAVVLPFVTGSIANDAALLRYHVPQTAAIKADSRISTVLYDGMPEFQPVEGTQVEAAVNTTSDVVKVSGRYYCCDGGVWFVSDTAVGPFQVTATIPEAVYAIPSSHPLYRLTFVHAFSSSENDRIWFGYYPGYLGSYLWNGNVVFGSGLSYRPWLGAWFLPRPLTWGWGAKFNPQTGGWGLGKALEGWIDLSRPSNSRLGANWFGVSSGGVEGNVYLKEGTRLAIHPKRESILGKSVEFSSVDPAKAPLQLLAAESGGVYQRDLTGYLQWQGVEWLRVTDVEKTQVLDRLLRDASAGFDPR